MSISLDKELALEGKSRFTSNFRWLCYVPNGLRQLEFPILPVSVIVELLGKTSTRESLDDTSNKHLEPYRRKEFISRMIQSHIDMGSIESINGQVRPQYFVEWALKSDFKLPSTWLEWYEWKKEQADYIHRDELPDTIKESERNALLKLVLGMAIKAYRYNPSAARNPATGENKGSIYADLERAGLSLDVKTIRKYIKEAETKFSDSILCKP